MLVFINCRYKSSVCKDIVQSDTIPFIVIIIIVFL
jgi:hypothetical protein